MNCRQSDWNPIDYATIELKTRGEIISLDNFNNRAIIARFLRNLANESDY